MMLASSLQAQDWMTELVKLNPDVIDSVVVMNDPYYVDIDVSSYMIYYHQPLKHDAPELGSLPLRAMLSTFDPIEGKPITGQLVQMYISGYELDEKMLIAPNKVFSEQPLTSPEELTDRYYGNLLQPEHRFYGTSCPEHPASLLGYCTAEEAAADFHALAEAVKKVFHGKWAITGTSKGGVATAIQHAYYPDDADCFVPYVAPFSNGVNDLRPQEYLMTQIWTPELREHFQHIVKEIFHRPGTFAQWMEENVESYEDATEEEKEKDRCHFLRLNLNTLISASITFPRDSMVYFMAENKEILKKHGLDDYTDEMLLHMSEIGVLSLRLWDFIHSAVAPTPAETRADNVFSIPEDKWVDKKTPYNFESANEKGYFDLKWDYYFDTQQEIDSVNAMWKRQVDNIANFSHDGVLSEVEFKPELLDFVLKQTAKATKPILFIYGGDDFWTGAHIEDEYINGENVRRYILPEQCHAACISDIKDQEVKEEIWAFLDKILRNKPDAIEQIGQSAAGAKTRYNLMGLPTDGSQGLSVEDGRVIFHL